MNTYSKSISLFFLGLLFLGCNSINEGVESSFNEDVCLVNDRKVATDPKQYKVNFFMETSGSMNGFMSKKGTEFQKDVYALVNQLDGSAQSGLTLFQIPAKGKSIKPSSMNDFRDRLNVGNFDFAASTDIPEILDSILLKTNENQVSIFVSDLIFSPSSGTKASLLQITSDIYKRFSGKKFSSIIYQLKSKIYNSKSVLVSNSSPYYVWVIGSEKGVKSVAGKLKSAMPSDYNEVDFGISHDQPKYTILPHIDETFNAIATRCERKKLYYCYAEFNDAENSKIMMNVGLNLGELSKNERDPAFLKENFYAGPSDAKIALKSIGALPVLKNTEDQTLAKSIEATHLLKMEVDHIYNDFALLQLNFKAKRPEWISASNLDIEDHQRNKTLGLTKMIEGLEKAYGSTALLFKDPFKLLITKNKQ
ncbi:hypothetical protein [Pedobacter gandavensis]|uniref:VWFA domain-containing protein n=1 Tax=Pedobacter gandavensis TaxID=2679963 RepID=A0ABR6EQQ8_9SPHI|nr:hypothetical protein [Pedobacter gandavensis]MBB2147593.1 hypothetical protein [Pedobacter gandavensis]